RSPMIFRSGSGNFRTNVGMATIWSSLASLGFSSRSTTSISYWPGRRSSQNRLRFSRAATHLGERPATYSLSRHLFAPSGVGFSPVDRSALALMSLAPLSIPIGPATPSHVRPILRQPTLPAPCLLDNLAKLLLLRFQVGAQGSDLGFQRLPAPLEIPLLPP